jgi:transcriptional regulator with XRE-family HTH domain
MSRKSAGASSPDAPVSEKMRMLFGQNCKAARVKAGLSQEIVAARTGIPQPRISKIELGKVNITLETMMILARVVNQDLLELLRQTTKPRDR